MEELYNIWNVLPNVDKNIKVGMLVSNFRHLLEALLDSKSMDFYLVDEDSVTGIRLTNWRNRHQIFNDIHFEYSLYTTLKESDKTYVLNKIGMLDLPASFSDWTGFRKFLDEHEDKELTQSDVSTVLSHLNFQPPARTFKNNTPSVMHQEDDDRYKQLIAKAIPDYILVSKPESMTWQELNNGMLLNSKKMKFNVYLNLKGVTLAPKKRK
jgi:hypothetical protein